MKLREKTAFILIGATIIIFVGVYVWSRFVLLNGFAVIEQDALHRDIEQVQDTLTNQIATIGTRTADWAYWDDAYQFVQDRNQSYIDKNMGYDQFASFSSLVSFILFFSPAGELVYSKGFDLDTKLEIPVPEGLLRQLRPGSPFLVHPDEKSKVEGLLLTKEGAYMAASRPILTSDVKGPIRGSLIFVGLLDERRTQDIGSTLRTSLKIHSLEQASALPEWRDAAYVLGDGREFVARALDEESIAAYTLLRDVSGKPILLLRLDKPRTVYGKGLRTLEYFGIGILVTGLLQGLIMLFMLRRTVLNPLTRLTQSLQGIESDADPSKRVPVQSRDELGELSQSINRTLNALEQAQTAVHFSEIRLRAVLENAVDGIVTMDEDGRITSFNKAAEEIFGWAGTEAIGKQVSMLMPEPYRGQHAAYLDSYLHTGEKKLIGMGRDILAMRKDGTVFPAYVAISEVSLAGQRLFTGIIRDITERKRYEEYLAHAAMHDPLTGLLNRRSLEEEFDVAMNSAKRYGHALSLCMCDLDQFKEINDRFGHAVGDQVLKCFGELVHAEIRKGDLGARFGGDEFCIVFSHTPSVDALICIERVRQALASRSFLTGTNQQFTVTASFGIADLITHEMDMKSLLEAADQALYRAKQEGRNRTVLQTH